MVKTIEENVEYIRMNSQQIAKHLEHINWNLGKIASILAKDEKTFEDIVEAEKQNAKEESN